MKTIYPIVILIALFGLVACGDTPQDRAQEADRHQRAATTYQQQGQFRAAMIEARNAIQQMPEQASGYLLLANIYNQVGAFSSTQSLLEGLQEQLPETGLELAEAYVYSKKHRSALNLLNNYPAESKDALRRLSIMARAYTALGDKSGFDQVLLEIAALPDPEAASEVMYLTAGYALSQGRQEDASKSLEALLAKEPQQVKALIMAGEIALYSNQLDAAEKQLTQALTLTQESDVMTVNRAMVLSHLTQVLIQQGRTSEAYIYQKLLADANPEGQAMQQKFADAMEFYQQGKLDDAEQLLTEIHTQYPSDKNAGTLLGLVQYQQGDDEQALELFNQFIDPETANPSVIQAAAVAKYRTNRADEALTLLKQAVDNQPNDATLLATYGLALLDHDSKSNDGALALEKSLAINPAQQRLRIALAKRYLGMEQVEQALAQLQKAYVEQPTDMVIQQTYFSALVDNGLEAQARQLADEYLQANPGSPRGFFLDGWLQLHQKKYGPAQLAFTKAVDLASGTERAMAYSGLAQAYEQNDQLQEAANTWQSALTEDPGLVAAYARWLTVMQKLDKSEEAVTYLKQLESQQKFWQPSVVLAQLYFNQRQLPTAITHINTALARSNGTEMVNRIAANLYSQQGLELKTQKKFPEARVSLLKALELSPENIGYLANMIDIELGAGDIPEAQKLLDHYPRSDDNLAAYLFLQGAIHRAENKPDDALRSYRQSWEERPSDNAGEAMYAHYSQQGQAAQADAVLDQWIAALPKSPRPTLIKAINAHQKQDIDTAITWYEATLTLAPDLSAAVNNLAWIYYERKDPRALELAKRAFDLSPASAPVLDTYGWVLVESGQVKEGIVYLERAANAAPEDKDIREHLKQARARLK